jgi:hypothetical protein
MKRIVLFLTIITTITSCTKLQEQPRSQLVADQFYKTKDDAIAAVNAVYSALNPSGQTIYNSLFQIGLDIASDDALPGPRARNPDVRSLSVLTYSVTNDRVSEIWKQHYDAINRANAAIDRIPPIQMDTALQARLVREAKFLRAVYYFNLVRLYGGVPLVLHETTAFDDYQLNVSRATADEVYAQIISDLTDAENLPIAYSSADIGRATSGAAKSILSKVYLTIQQWDKAAAKSLEVINGPYGYDLFENFADVFKVATENGKEHIFSIQFKSNAGGHGNSLAVRSTPNGIPGISGDNADMPNVGVYQLYSEKDKRRDVTFYTSLTSPVDGKTYTFAPLFGKYRDPAVYTNPAESGVDVPLIRFAEVLLIYAEALNEQNGPTTEAYNAINRVRARAGLDPLENLSQDQFRDAVYLERRLELMYEYQRWFDLVRTHRMVEALHAQGKPNATEKYYLYPIPQREMDLNPSLEQNPLWQ